MILGIKTDTACVEVFLLNNNTVSAHIVRELGREMSLELPGIIENVIDDFGGWTCLSGIVCFGGPGSFTGLRIGHSIANSLSYALNIPVVQGVDQEWLTEGEIKLREGSNEKVIVPMYGSEANITKPKK